MSLFVLDTDTLTLFQHRHAQVCQQVAGHPSTDVVITVITIQEQLDGWRNALNRARTRQTIAEAYDFLGTMLLPAYLHFRVLLFPEPAILRFESLVALRLNVGRMDLRIGAIALENNAKVVTRNQRDFSRIPGLVLEDWSV